ncbi:MAG: hypothetical protein AAFY28_21190, partial [Actinomycetota bacterium]
GGAQAILNVVKVDVDGTICIRSQRAAVGTIVDLIGFIDSDAEPFTRTIDTRLLPWRLDGGVERCIEVGPPNSAFAGTVVVTNPAQPGWIGVYTESERYPGTSTLNSDGINSASNFVLMPTNDAGEICLRSKRGLSAEVIIDGTIVPELAGLIEPRAFRLFDSRFDDLAEDTAPTFELLAAGGGSPILPAQIVEARCIHAFQPGVFPFWTKELVIDLEGLESPSGDVESGSAVMIRPRDLDDDQLDFERSTLERADAEGRATVRAWWRSQTGDGIHLPLSGTIALSHRSPGDVFELGEGVSEFRFRVACAPV